MWDIGRDFGTIGCRRVPGAVEVTTYRSESYDPASRKPLVDFGDSLAGDLRPARLHGQRDGRLAAGPEFVDPYGGVVDLANRVLRTPGRPEDSFSDDPLRMLRAARFAAQLAFTVDPGVVTAMTAMADRISIISAERVRDELAKLVLAPYPRVGLTLLVETGLAARVLPELPALALERDEHHRHKDVYEHTLTVLEQSIDLEEPAGWPGPGLAAGRADARRRQAAHATVPRRRLGDVPPPRRGRRQADPKAAAGAALLQRHGRRRRPLVELHLRFHGYGGGEWTDSAVRRYVRDAGDQLERLHVLTRADCTTRNRRKAERLRRTYDELEPRIARLSEQEELAAIRPDLDGSQIMEILGIPPGPTSGRPTGSCSSFASTRAR